jgi:hypothetical protein
MDVTGRDEFAIGSTKIVPMTGALQCFCKERENGDPLGKLAAYAELTRMYTYTSVDKSEHSAPLCKPWAEDYFSSLYNNNSIKYLIIMLNYVIRVVVIWIIKKVRCSTESRQMVYITNVVFIC